MIKTVVIEITHSHLKIVQSLPVQGVATITYCDLLPIAGLSDEAITDKIKGLKRARGLKLQGSRLIVVIPRQYAILRYLQLPSSQETEIRKMVDLQAANHIPYAREDVSIDFVVLSTDAEGFSKVMLMAIPKDIIMRYWKILTAAKLTPHQISLSSVGIWQWYVPQAALADQTVALIDIDEEASEICFCDKKHLWTSRPLALGIRQLQQGKEAEFIKQMDMTVAGYQKEKLGPAPAKVLVASSLENADELCRKLEAEFAVETQVVRFFERINVKKNLVWPKEARRGEIALSACVGMAVCQSSIDFTPQDIKMANLQRAQHRQVFRLTLLALMALVAIAFALSLGFLEKNTYLRSLEDQLRASKKQVAQIEKKQQQIELLKSVLNNRIIFVDVVDEIYRILPNNISLINFSLNGSTLSIQGYTVQGADINQLQRSMVESPIFENVNLDYVNKRATQEGETNYFKLTCQLKAKNK